MSPTPLSVQSSPFATPTPDPKPASKQPSCSHLPSSQDNMQHANSQQNTQFVDHLC